MRWNLLILFFITTITVSCTDEIELISAEKVKIIPGLSTLNPYTQYNIEFLTHKNETITIDIEKTKASNFKNQEVTFGIVEVTSEKTISKIITKGKYRLIIQSTTEVADLKELKIYYKVQNTTKDFLITSFEYKEKRMR